jgi:hypothetical protein
VKIFFVLKEITRSGITMINKADPKWSAIEKSIILSAFKKSDNKRLHHSKRREYI